MRVGIALTGTVLAAAGVTVLSLGLGGGDLAGRPVLDAPVFASPVFDSTVFDSTVLDSTVLDPAVTGGAVWTRAAGPAAALLALFGLVWLAGQVRATVRRRRPALDRPTRALARDAGRDLLGDLLGLPGVLDAGLRLTGTRSRPRLLLEVACARDAILGEVYGELGAGPVERYRTATALPDLVVAVRFRLAGAAPDRPPGTRPVAG